MWVVPAVTDAWEGAGRPPWQRAGIAAPQLCTGSSPRGSGHGGRTRGASTGGASEAARGHGGSPESRAELLRWLAGVARGAALAAGRREPKGRSWHRGGGGRTRWEAAALVGSEGVRV
jgi:hypothetical protein